MQINNSFRALNAYISPVNLYKQISNKKYILLTKDDLYVQTEKNITWTSIFCTILFFN